MKKRMLHFSLIALCTVSYEINSMDKVYARATELLSEFPLSVNLNTRPMLNPNLNEKMPQYLYIIEEISVWEACKIKEMLYSCIHVMFTTEMQIKKTIKDLGIPSSCVILRIETNKVEGYLDYESIENTETTEKFWHLYGWVPTAAVTVLSVAELLNK